MIGDRIRKERISKNITQEYLAKALDVSPSTIGMYEQNRRIPDNEMTIKIANYFGVFGVVGCILLKLARMAREMARIFDEIKAVTLYVVCNYIARKPYACQL